MTRNLITILVIAIVVALTAGVAIAIGIDGEGTNQLEAGIPTMPTVSAP